MAIEVRVPVLGESISEATVAQWFKAVGDKVKADMPLAELETDKVTVEVMAPADGVLSEIRVGDGEKVDVGAIIGVIDEHAGGDQPSDAEVRVADTPSAGVVKAQVEAGGSGPKADRGDMPPSPSARKLMAEKGLSVPTISGSGRRGQILKSDVVNAAADVRKTAVSATGTPPQDAPSAPSQEVREERVRMSRLRQTIAQRLKDAQNSAAILTTFNEVDMSNVMALRARYKDLFEKKHGVKLGFMSFFVKACVHALYDVPAVNAEIDGTDLVYKNYYHIGVAVGADKGLVVPVVRDADRLGFADIEKAINDFGRRARDGKLGLEEMKGGTFTISNGGVYGSLMSTPILNAPQSGILGMHRIQDRPVVVNGQIMIRPMMYLALSYDHRVVDGKEAVTFLVRIKDLIEDPQRLIVDL